MNLNQAKKAVGIGRDETLVTKEALQAAILLCEHDQQNEAKEIFIKRIARLWGQRPERKNNTAANITRTKAATRQVKEAARSVGLVRPPVSKVQLKAAIQTCKDLLKHEHPDTGGSDEAARKIIAAMKVFQSTTIPTCPVCGDRLARGAKFCRIHQRQKKLPDTSQQPAVNTEPKRNANDRVSVVGDPLALLGYYTAPVQKIVSKWRKEIGETKLQSYFESVASPVVFRECEIQLPIVAPQHWQAVFELGQAICAVMNNTKQPHAWLLRTPGIHVATNGRYLSIAEIRQWIIDAGGKDFTRGNIAQALKGLRLATSDELAAEWRKSVMKKTG